MLAFFVGFVSEMFHRSNGNPDCPRCHGSGRWADYSTKTMRDCGCAGGSSRVVGAPVGAPAGGGSHVLRWVLIGAFVLFVVLPVLASL